MNEQISMGELLGEPPTPPKPEIRCTERKHVIEKEQTNFCDCNKFRIGVTAAGNAYVVTVMP